MNERFEQMMLEATKDMPQGYYVPGEYFQKFAELIVKECALVVHKKTGPKSALNVLDHFGVEE